MYAIKIKTLSGWVSILAKQSLLQSCTCVDKTFSNLVVLVIREIFCHYFAQYIGTYTVAHTCQGLIKDFL